MTGGVPRVRIRAEWAAEAIPVMRGMLPPGISVSPDDSGDCEILVAGRPTAELLDSLPSLSALVIPWAGIPPALAGLLEGRPRIRVYNLHHNAPAAAELAIGLLLAAARRIVPDDAALRRGDWRPRYTQSGALIVHGSRAVVAGYGSVGRRVAAVLLSMGAHVSATRRSVSTAVTEDGVHIVPPHGLGGILEGADILVLTVPLTVETRGLVGAHELSLLAVGSVLVNVARAEVVDEKALYEGLVSGRPGAAGLDVWYSYPEDEGARLSTMPSDRPFHELPNVVMSPHKGGAFGVPALERTRIEHLVRLLAALSTDDADPWRVDPGRGY